MMSETIAPATPPPGRRQQRLVSRPPRMTCTIATVVEITGLSETSIRKLLSEGQLHGITIAGRRLVYLRSVRQLIGEED